MRVPEVNPKLYKLPSNHHAFLIDSVEFKFRSKVLVGRIKITKY